ncbi:MAG: isoprenylcysteine carboxylmethyltransferase family protein [Actinobacteria bacterium]|nr:MAG: isoprenylcysteine carboxylmethyltransferase family protein [Actinomycetota bacterium]
MPLLLHDPVAHWLIVAAAVAVVAGEIVATYLGHARDGERRVVGSLADSLLLYVHGRGASMRQDRGTRLIIALALYLGIAAALAIARLPGLRVYANNWWTLGLGLTIVLAGAVLRDWAILSLGRYFRREVTIEPGQRIVRRGPYRMLRHPSYTGICLILGGFGLAFGSWVSAGAAVLIVFVGMLPRIRVEERALAQAFGSDYAAYTMSTDRILPHVW